MAISYDLRAIICFVRYGWTGSRARSTVLIFSAHLTRWNTITAGEKQLLRSSSRRNFRGWNETKYEARKMSRLLSTWTIRGTESPLWKFMHLYPFWPMCLPSTANGGLESSDGYGVSVRIFPWTDLPYFIWIYVFGNNSTGWRIRVYWILLEICPRYKTHYSKNLSIHKLFYCGAIFTEGFKIVCLI